MGPVGFRSAIVFQNGIGRFHKVGYVVANVPYFFVKGCKNIKGADSHRHEDKDKGLNFIVLSVFHVTLIGGTLECYPVCGFLNKQESNQ